MTDDDVCNACGLVIDTHAHLDGSEYDGDTHGGGEKIHYVRRSRGLDAPDSPPKGKGGSAPYNRVYYHNERFSVLRNSDALIKLDDLRLILSPVFDAPTLPGKEKGQNDWFSREHSPDEWPRERIVELCKKAKLEQRAEKWIQIKWRLFNDLLKYHYWDFQGGVCPRTYKDMTPWSNIKLGDRPIPGTAKWEAEKHHLNWIPDFPSAETLARVKEVFNRLKEGFDCLKRAPREFALDSCPRKSFLGWDWTFVRALYMVCDGVHRHSPTTAGCLVARHSWALKPLLTAGKIRKHVNIFLILMAYVKRTLSENELSSKEINWHVVEDDEDLRRYRPAECHSNALNISAATDSDLAYHPLPRRPERKSPLLYPPPLPRNSINSINETEQTEYEPSSFSSESPSFGTTWPQDDECEDDETPEDGDDLSFTPGRRPKQRKPRPKDWKVKKFLRDLQQTTEADAERRRKLRNRL